MLEEKGDCIQLSDKQKVSIYIRDKLQEALDLKEVFLPKQIILNH